MNDEQTSAAGKSGMQRSQIVTWCLYDFANSSYSAVIVATMFATYYANVIVGNDNGIGDLWWGRAISLSMLVVALSAPIIGGIADSGGIRKRLWIAYTAVTILAVIGFTFLEPGMLFTGFFLIVVANIGMEGGFVFYNSFLPEIAPPSHQGRVSGWGYATGYAGSIVALLLAYQFVDPFQPRAIWLVVAVLFTVFSIPAFIVMPGAKPATVGLRRSAFDGARQSLRNLAELWGNSQARRFLIGYIFYQDGVNTAIVFTSVFAATTMGFTNGELIKLFVVVQLSALAGAWSLAKTTDVRGPKVVVVGGLLIWCVATGGAYLVQTKPAFWVVCVVFGLGLGSVQAASRSLFAAFIPEGREAQYFGAYALVGKSAAVLGPILFGEVSRAFGGNQRPAILSVAIFFIIGLFFVSRVQVPKRSGKTAASEA